MSTSQSKFADILLKKKRIIGIDMQAVRRWKKGTTSPSLHNVARICEVNEIEQPFFFDGDLAGLTEYVNKVSARLGLKAEINYKSI